MASVLGIAFRGAQGQGTSVSHVRAPPPPEEEVESRVYKPLFHLLLLHPETKDASGRLCHGHWVSQVQAGHFCTADTFHSRRIALCVTF